MCEKIIDANEPWAKNGVEKIKKVLREQDLTYSEVSFLLETVNRQIQSKKWGFKFK